jgi:autoinducer-2 kinase
VTAANLERIFAFTGVVSDELVFAGGASKGALWCQILADVTGMAVKVPRVREAPAFGAAVAAGVGAGAYASLPEAMDRLVGWAHAYEPDAERHEVYRGVRDRWAQAYERQRDLVDAGVTTSMWRAPGVRLG